MSGVCSAQLPAYDTLLSLPTKEGTFIYGWNNLSAHLSSVSVKPCYFISPNYSLLQLVFSIQTAGGWKLERQ